MSITRSTMQFLLPLNIDGVKEDTVANRSIVPLYINPKTFDITEGKIFNESLTKGGYVIQYWGEKLAEIQVSGTTGSGGPEAINILRAIYRHEQIIFDELLLERASTLAQTSSSEINSSSTATAEAGIASILNTITNDGFSGIVDGISSVIETALDSFEGITSQSAQVELFPTLASFAISIDLSFQGEIFRGFFSAFSSKENADSPGIFDYTFTFKVTRRTGTRNNFMPWHRNPRDLTGAPIKSEIPNGRNNDGLSFPSSFSTISLPSVTAVQDQGSTEVITNRVPLNRNELVKS